MFYSVSVHQPLGKQTGHRLLIPIPIPLLLNRLVFTILLASLLL